MKELLDEYKKTAKQTRAMHKNLNNRIEDCETNMEVMKNAAQHPDDKSDVLIMTADEIEDWTKEEWNIPKEWRLLAQMPIGIAYDELPEKYSMPVAERVFYHE